MSTSAENFYEKDPHHMVLDSSAVNVLDRSEQAIGYRLKRQENSSIT